LPIKQCHLSLGLFFRLLHLTLYILLCLGHFAFERLVTFFNCLIHVVGNARANDCEENTSTNKKERTGGQAAKHDTKPSAEAAANCLVAMVDRDVGVAMVNSDMSDGPGWLR